MHEKELQRIADQLTRSIEGDAWHGPSLFELLDNISADKASSKAITNGHSIWEIVLHITVWMDVGVRRINGEPADPQGEDDWPTVNNTSEEAWKSSITSLKDTYKKLKYEILNFPEARLNDKLPGRSQTFYILFHGIVQHNLYHAGQIAILKK